MRWATGRGRCNRASANAGPSAGCGPERWRDVVILRIQDARTVARTLITDLWPVRRPVDTRVRFGYRTPGVGAERAHNTGQDEFTLGSTEDGAVYTVGWFGGQSRWSHQPEDGFELD